MQVMKANSLITKSAPLHRGIDHYDSMPLLEPYTKKNNKTMIALITPDQMIMIADIAHGNIWHAFNMACWAC